MSALPFADAHETSHQAWFAAQQPNSASLVITVNGEIDAHNADDLADYVVRHLTSTRILVIDLSTLQFLAVQGFCALMTVVDTVAARGVTSVLVPGTAARRALRVCDPDGTLAVAPSLAEALTTVSPRHLATA